MAFLSASQKNERYQESDAFSVTEGAEAADAAEAPVQELWLALDRRDWRSVVLVPVGLSQPVAAVAHSLAAAGRWLHEATGTFTMASAVDSPEALAFVKGARTEATGGGRSIVAILPVVDERLGVVVARAADAVVLCVEMGRTRLAAIRRTVELIGRNRIAGCFVVK